MLFGEMDFDEHRLIIDGIDLMQRHVKFTSSQPHKTSNPEYLKPINILSQKTSNNKLLDLKNTRPKILRLEIPK